MCCLKEGWRDGLALGFKFQHHWRFVMSICSCGMHDQAQRRLSYAQAQRVQSKLQPSLFVRDSRGLESCGGVAILAPESKAAPEHAWPKPLWKVLQGVGPSFTVRILPENQFTVGSHHSARDYAIELRGGHRHPHAASRHAGECHADMALSSMWTQAFQCKSMDNSAHTKLWINNQKWTPRRPKLVWSHNKVGPKLAQGPESPKSCPKINRKLVLTRPKVSPKSSPCLPKLISISPLRTSPWTKTE